MSTGLVSELGENIDAKEFLDLVEQKKEELTTTERNRVGGVIFVLHCPCGATGRECHG